jgi:hypothetical protein
MAPNNDTKPTTHEYNDAKFSVWKCDDGTNDEQPKHHEQHGESNDEQPTIHEYDDGYNDAKSKLSAAVHGAMDDDEGLTVYE